MVTLLILAMLAVQTAQADPADTTALADAIGQAEKVADTIKAAYPFEASVLAGVIDGCKQVQNNENATQAEVDFAAATMNQSLLQVACSTLHRELTTLVAQGEVLLDSCQTKHPDCIGDLRGALSNSTYSLSLPDAQPLLLQISVMGMQQAITNTKVAVMRKDIAEDIALTEAFADSIRGIYPQHADAVIGTLNIFQIKQTLDDPNATPEDIRITALLARALLRSAKEVLAHKILDASIPEAEEYYNSIKENNPCTSSVLQHVVGAVKQVNDNRDALYQDLELAISVLNLVMQQTKTAIETGINDVQAAARVAGAYYDLNGRRLSGKPSTKGIYINGGQKIITK